MPSSGVDELHRWCGGDTLGVYGREALGGVHEPAGLSRIRGQLFVHEAFYYRDTEEFLAGTVRFAHDGLARGEPVLMAVPEPRLSLLRSRLAAADGGVRFVDMADAGRNPNRILPWVLRAFAQEHESRRVNIVGEPIYVGRRPEEIDPCVQHEALINIAFDGIDASILCPYDVALLADVVRYAEATHPIVVDGGERRASRAYAEPDTVVAGANQPLPEPGHVDEALTFDLDGLAQVRGLVGQYAGSVGLSAERIGEIQLAVTEIASNAVTYPSPGVATLRVWAQPDRLVCEIQGSGQILDIMAGRVVPALDSLRGRGILIANRFCDLVQTYTTPEGTITRLHMWL
jgi:anti-sigma regulatory factor (Ser/Thr protein kinase)